MRQQKKTVKTSEQREREREIESDKLRVRNPKLSEK